MRKVLSLTLALLMLVMILPIGIFTASADDAVAKIIHADTTETPYASLKDACAAVADGETVKLLADVTVGTEAGTGALSGRRDEERLSFVAGGAYTFDGDGHTLTYYYNANASVSYLFALAWVESTVTVKNTTFSAGGDTYGFIVRNNNKLILENCTLTLAKDAQTFLLNGGVAEIKNCKFNNAISVTSNSDAGTCTIDNCSMTKISADGLTDTTITNTVFDIQYTPVQVYNATLTFGEGVVMDATATNSLGNVKQDAQMLRIHKPGAVLNITGGVFKTGTGFMIGQSGTAGDATADQHVSINISGGEFVTASSSMFELPSSATLTVSGGSFTTDTGKMFSTKSNVITISGGNFSAGATNQKGGNGNFFDLTSGNNTVNISGGHLKHVANQGGRCVQVTATPNIINISGGVIDLAGEYMFNLNGPHTVTVTGGYFIASKYVTSDGFEAPAHQMFWLNGTNNTAELGGSLTASNFVYVCDGGTQKFAGVYNPGGKAESTLNISGGVYFNKNGNQTAEQLGFTALPATREGGSIRLVDDSNGLRFTSTIAKAVVDTAKSKADQGTEVTYGTIIAPTDYAEGLKFNKYTLDALGASYKEIVATEVGSDTDEDGNVTVRAALVNIQDGNLARKFSAVAFVKYVENGKTVYLFGDYDEAKNSRSIAEVADAALKDIKTTQTSIYNYAVEGGYSRYTEAQRTTLAGFAAALN